MPSDEKDYATAGRPEFGGPLGFKDAARAVEEAAHEAKVTAEKAGKLIELATMMLESFRLTWGWLLFRK